MSNPRANIRCLHRAARFFLFATLAAIPAAAHPLFAADKPVQVYILSGQSNMVGIGQVVSGSTRWGDEFSDPVVSIYEGEYDTSKDYDSLEPIRTMPVGKFGGTDPEKYPAEGTQIVRGFFTPKNSGVYQFSSGWGEASYNIMIVNGIEAYRREPGADAQHKDVKLAGGEKVPFSITYFEPNGRGLGWITRMDVPGTLTTLVKQQGEFPYLLDEDGEWLSRDDVWYRGVVTAGANKWLAPGCGATPSMIGPELGFGHKVGDLHAAPVLIIKAAQGNRSLGWDFLPPGSERFEIDGTVFAGYKDPKSSWPVGEEPEKGGWYAGKQYDDCVNAAKEVLADFDGNFPHWAGRGYEIAGFGWFQGHKDAGSEIHAARYEMNLVNLIKALRGDFDAPDAPFVIAVGCGSEAREGNALTVANAQLAVCGSAGNYPEFKGNVITVDTRDYFPDAAESPMNQGYHYHQNAGAYMRIGEAMGRGMVELKK